MSEEDLEEKAPVKEKSRTIALPMLVAAGLSAGATFMATSTEFLDKVQEIVGNVVGYYSGGESASARDGIDHAYVTMPYRNSEYCQMFSRQLFDELGYEEIASNPRIDTIEYSKDGVHMETRCIFDQKVGTAHLLFVAADKDYKALKAVHNRAKNKYTRESKNNVPEDFIGNPDRLLRMVALQLKPDDDEYVEHGLSIFDTYISARKESGFVSHLMASGLTLKACQRDSCVLYRDGGVVVVTPSVDDENGNRVLFVLFSSGYVKHLGDNHLVFDDREVEALLTGYEGYVDMDYVFADW